MSTVTTTPPAALRHGAIGDPTVAWLDSAFRFMRKFNDPRFPREIRTPTLIVAAGADPVCATPVIERFGLRGFGAHSNDAEYVDIDSIEPRLYLAARMIMDL